jgi:hypothetical protein
MDFDIAARAGFLCDKAQDSYRAQEHDDWGAINKSFG